MCLLIGCRALVFCARYLFLSSFIRHARHYSRAVSVSLQRRRAVRAIRAINIFWMLRGLFFLLLRASVLLFDGEIARRIFIGCLNLTRTAGQILQLIHVGMKVAYLLHFKGIRMILFREINVISLIQNNIARFDHEYVTINNSPSSTTFITPRPHKNLEKNIISQLRPVIAATP